MVREAVGLAAYAAGDWATAIAELRTYHRMTGMQSHLAEIADSERALGRPERAIDLYRGADKDALEKGGAIELLIVAAGARGDLGQHDAAVAMLQVRELTNDEDAEWAARLRYAYADALLAAGRRDEAREWFSRAAEVDADEVTDAAERLLELDGVTLEDDSDEDDTDENEADENEADENEAYVNDGDRDDAGEARVDAGRVDVDDDLDEDDAEETRLDAGGAEAGLVDVDEEDDLNDEDDFDEETRVADATAGEARVADQSAAAPGPDELGSGDPDTVVAVAEVSDVRDPEPPAGEPAARETAAPLDDAEIHAAAEHARQDLAKAEAKDDLTEDGTELVDVADTEDTDDTDEKVDGDEFVAGGASTDRDDVDRAGDRPAG